MARTSKTVKGKTTDTEFNAAGRPVKVDYGDKQVSYAYDQRGKVIRRESSGGEVLEIEYHIKWNKVCRVLSYSKDYPEQATEFLYEFNGIGDMIRITSTKGIDISVGYNRRGRIAEIAAGDIVASCDVSAGALVMSIAGKGAISFAITETGEIEIVNNEMEKNIANEVTALVRQLLDAICPDGMPLEI